MSKEHPVKPGWYLKLKSKQRVDFILGLVDLSQEGSVLEIDGGAAMAEEVRRFFSGFEVLETMEIDSFYLLRWPMFKNQSGVPCRFRLPLNREVIDVIVGFLNRLPEPEVLDHLYVLDSSGELVVDGFRFCYNGKIYLSEKVSESRLKEVCSPKSIKYVPCERQ